MRYNQQFIKRGPVANTSAYGAVSTADTPEFSTDPLSVVKRRPLTYTHVLVLGITALSLFSCGIVAAISAATTRTASGYPSAVCAVATIAYTLMAWARLSYPDEDKYVQQLTDGIRSSDWLVRCMLPCP